MIRTLIFLSIILCSFSSLAQKLSPIQAVRAIDEAFSDAHVAAIEANRTTLYIDQCNIAKSFVHADMNEKALDAYAKALNIALPNKTHTTMLNEARRILTDVDMELVYDDRTNGVDENHQAVKRETAFAQESYTQGEAADKIDEMLSFLHENTVRDPARKSQLIGDLKYCRELILDGELEEASNEYHATIIQYLDPRWTSQLLGNIGNVFDNTVVTFRPGKDNTVNAMNSDMNSGSKGANAEGKMDAADMSNTAQAKGGSDYIALPTEADPILYFKEEMEGRVIERIRLMEDHELMTYKKVKHNWGKTFYFINEEPSTITEWLRIQELYHNMK